MSDSICMFAYRVVGGDRIDAVRSLWEKLRAHHSPLLAGFPGAMPPFNFEPRKQEILGKAAAIRIELVSATSDGLDIAYCISTVTRDSVGEIDSMFVEEAFRG